MKKYDYLVEIIVPIQVSATCRDEASILAERVLSRFPKREILRRAYQRDDSVELACPICAICDYADGICSTVVCEDCT